MNKKQGFSLPISNCWVVYITVILYSVDQLIRPQVPNNTPNPVPMCHLHTHRLTQTHTSQHPTNTPLHTQPNTDTHVSLSLYCNREGY